MPPTVEPVVNELRKDSPQASRFAGRRVHFIGIGGCGMNGLARILLDCGAIISGSEPKPNPQTFELTRRGANISRDQCGQCLSREVDLVVRTAAIHDNNPEYLVARKLGLEVIKYAALLGQVMQERMGIAVAGTHGKSTTTAMIAFAMSQCGADPSFVVGGTIPQLGNLGSHSGAGPAFVAEACEFDRSFHNLHPRVAIVTNIEEDHLDCYKDLDDIIDSFRTFAAKVPADGVIISLAHDPVCKKALAEAPAPIQWVGLQDDADWQAVPLGIENGCHVGEIRHNGQKVGELHLGVAGLHNLLNATMAIAAMHACNVDLTSAITALGQFTGVDRRMTFMGQYNGANVVDDYGHHPTEIRATLSALRERYKPRRLLCVFQPHQHSRTRFLLEDFAHSFQQADLTIVPDIYFVRDSETEKQRVCAGDLVDRIKANGQEALYLPDFQAIVKYLQVNAAEGDLVLTLGAGNVWEIGRDLTQ